MILLAISFILSCVSIGMDEWSSMEVRRGATTASIDSGTIKTQGIARRCVRYMLSEDLSNVPLDEQPQGGCLFVGEMECNLERSFLESAHDQPSINELQNTDNIGQCSEGMCVHNGVSIVASVHVDRVTTVTIGLAVDLWPNVFIVVINSNI